MRSKYGSTSPPSSASQPAFTALLSTAATVLAPDLAMRGANPETNLVRALDGLRQARRHIYCVYYVSIVLFQFALIGVAVYTLCNKLYLEDSGSGSEGNPPEDVPEFDSLLDSYSEPNTSNAANATGSPTGANTTNITVSPTAARGPARLSDADRAIYLSGGVACSVILIISLVSSAHVGLKIKRRFGKSNIMYAQDGRAVKTPEPFT